MIFPGELKTLYPVDISKLISVLPADSDPAWIIDRGRQLRNRREHGDTLNIRAVAERLPWKGGAVFDAPKNAKYTQVLTDEVYKLAKELATFFDGVIIQAVLILLPAGKKVLEHVDGPPLDRVHRCHIPLIVNSSCTLTVNGTEYKPQPGMAYELNNQLLHKADNSGDTSRIHLLVDILPNGNI